MLCEASAVKGFSSCAIPVSWVKARSLTMRLAIISEKALWTQSSLYIASHGFGVYGTVILMPCSCLPPPWLRENAQSVENALSKQIKSRLGALPERDREHR